MADANMEHHGADMHQVQFVRALEQIAAGLSQQNAQIYQDFQSHMQGTDCGVRASRLLRAELRQCKQRDAVNDYAKDFCRLIAQIHGTHPLDQVDHFCESLKSEAKTEVMYLRCSTLVNAIAAAQAYERTHFSGERTNGTSFSRCSASSAVDGATPMDLSTVDSRHIGMSTCGERNL
ncbi:hypothetical protein PHMEG_0008964 [Phytophthora megakarya]|uniref:Uncharacterized protein n=1 Tax=Phytophthora megakarya TaxID=4795 RepID=A0A225WIR1_9STRA|nr:hypothetical protein PHMEG_0008964 [Phytophthora megakarya]